MILDKTNKLLLLTDSTLNQDRPCQLHGCSVELLQCSGSRLKQTADGCTLCECEDEGTNNIFKVYVKLLIFKIN